jgi:signal transduction histidine kinase
MKSLAIKQDIKPVHFLRSSGSGCFINRNIQSQEIMRPPIVKKEADKFTRLLAHEIRNPLTNINLSLEVLENEVHDDSLKIYLDIIKRGSKRINELLNEVLKNHQPESMKMESSSIHQLLDEVLTMTSDRIALKNILVSREYCVQGCVMAMNRPDMKIALTNIFINAIDAMPSNNGVLKLVTASDSTSFIIQIKDNGCGISKEHLKDIFKPYFTNKPGGVGLGLSATYEILIANQIDIIVESEEGVGTNFILTLNKAIEANKLFSLKLFSK